MWMNAVNLDSVIEIGNKKKKKKWERLDLYAFECCRLWYANIYITADAEKGTIDIWHPIFQNLEHGCDTHFPSSGHE